MTDWMRSRPKRDLILALTVAGVFALGTGAFMFGSFGPGGHHRASYVYETASAGGVLYDQSFDVSPGALLVVKVSDFDVVISSHSGRQAEVMLRVDEDEEYSGDALERMGFRVERTSEGIEITTESRGRGNWDLDDLDGTLHVTVPTRFDVQVQTGDGDVAVESIEGSVMLRTGDGDIALGGATGSEVMIQTGDGDVAVGGTASRHIVIQTGDGDVALGRLDAEDVQVRTGDGDILIEDLSGSLRASTGDGDVMLHIDEFAGVQITTGDGDVTLYAPASLAADISIIGEDLFLSDVFALPAQLEGRKFEGSLNGGGPELSVRVGDGSIRIIER
ncbi:MAG: DUF4097 domain-containing protein [Gemmatimonadota bacterium]